MQTRLKTGMNNRIPFVLMAVIWFLGIASAFGRDAIEVESRYDGDGWFHYRIRTLEDPFFTKIHFGQLLPTPFLNYLTNTLPNHWTNFYYKGEWSGLMFDGTDRQPRINEISFSVRSTSTHFRRQAHGFNTSVFLQFADVYFLPGGGIGGYVNLDCLLPCAPEEADGSLPALVSRHEFVPDIKIDELIRTNQDIHGLTFSWAEPSTVELQGSHNLVEWATVSRIFGNPPQTTWTTNVSLNSFGQFFRLSLVANSHLQAAGAIVSKSNYSTEIPIKSLEFIDGQIRIGFASVPNTSYALEQRESFGRTIATRQIKATTAFTTLSFDVREPRGAAFFKLRIFDSKNGEPSAPGNSR